MPQHSQSYANLIKQQNVELVGIQEGAEDWEITSQYPTDYSRAIALQTALGNCWARQFQIFINQCKGLKLIDSQRFDLTDGPQATRTGEWTIIEKLGKKILFVNVHWDHQNQSTTLKNALETVNFILSKQTLPVILLGDFNTECHSQPTQTLIEKTQLTLVGNAGIDCIFAKKLSGKGIKINAKPSDHPSVVATLAIEAGSPTD